jgi:hypothetical protein
VREIARLAHHGDESFVSAALNTLADDGQQIVELGAYQAIGRHWAGNAYRELRWFQSCCFVHLPGSKALIERESRYAEFSAARFWRHVSTAHLLGRARFNAKRLFGMLPLAPKRFNQFGMHKTSTTPCPVETPEANATDSVSYSGEPRERATSR